MCALAAKAGAGSQLVGSNLLSLAGLDLSLGLGPRGRKWGQRFSVHVCNLDERKQRGPDWWESLAIPTHTAKTLPAVVF